MFLREIFQIQTQNINSLPNPVKIFDPDPSLVNRPKCSFKKKAQKILFIFQNIEVFVCEASSFPSIFTFSFLRKQTSKFSFLIK